MIGQAFRRVMWVGKVTTFCVGLAVVLAVVFGVTTTALAAVPSDPFKLGRANVIDRITTLAGSVAGPVLRLDNNGGGPALALESNAGRPPLTVNAESGKATNLDADRLDGKSAEDFQAVGTKAADSETLDGLDSGRFLRRPSYTAPVKSAADSSRHKTVTASCPPDHLAIGASARITATNSPGTGSEVPVGLTASYGGYGGWRAEAQEMVDWEGEWYLMVRPICVFEESGIVRAEEGP